MSKKPAKPTSSKLGEDTWTGAERRRAKTRRSDSRRLDQRRRAGIGEIMEDRREDEDTGRRRDDRRDDRDRRSSD